MIWKAFLNAFILRKIKIQCLSPKPQRCQRHKASVQVLAAAWLTPENKQETKIAAPAGFLLGYTMREDKNQGLLPVLSTEEKFHLWSSSQAGRVWQTCPPGQQFMPELNSCLVQSAKSLWFHSQCSFGHFWDVYKQDFQ